jgi:tRNA(Ile)-lysidine synthase
MPVSKPWIDRVERRLARWSERGLGQTWVVAVSGGSDSVGLLLVLHRLASSLGLRLTIAHLDHGVRGESARADAVFVAALAGSLDLPFVAGEWQPTRSGHFESDARRARYDWLMEVARESGASVIAVGHTLDDQAETILHRILRGTGPRGLAGIPWRRTLSQTPRLTLVRPLLRVSRREVRDFLAAHGQPFREDASNADLARTRARIRHDLLPKLATEYNPNVAKALVRLGSLASSLENAIDADLRKLEKSVIISRDENCVMLKHSVLRSIPPFQRAEVLRRVWRSAGWPEVNMSASRWRRLAALVENEKIPGIEVGDQVEVWTENFFLFLRRRQPSTQAAAVVDVLEPIALSVPGQTAVAWASGAIEARVNPGAEMTVDETIDLDQTSVPLVVRPARPGDRFAPLGMMGQSMALADFFRGRNVAREKRARVPLVCDQIGVIWVVGHRIADRVKVSEKTKRKLGLRWCDDER